MPRSQFDQELNKMHVDLDRMCHLVVLAIENCVTAFKEQDYELAQDIIHGDSFLMIGHIQDMAKIATKMVKEALDAFHQHDLNHALEVKKMDIKMDELFDQVKEDIIQMIKESNDKGDLTINFLMIAKYFERIGDHVVNICEWIEFNQTGKLNNTRLI